MPLPDANFERADAGIGTHLPGPSATDLAGQMALSAAWRSRAKARMLVAGLSAVFTVWLILVWERLPAKPITQFDDGVGGNQVMVGAGALPFAVTQILLALFFLSAPLWVRWVSGSLRIPHARYWLSDFKRRAVFNERLATAFTWLGVLLTLFLIGVNVVVVRAQLDGRMNFSATLLLTLGLMFSILGWFVGLWRVLRPPATAK